MKIKERLNQIIVGLREESVRYPRMKTTDVIYILSNVISTVYEDEKPIIPQPKQETIEEVKDLNIKELETKFDALLESFTTEEIKEWNRFDKHKEILEKFLLDNSNPLK